MNETDKKEENQKPKVSKLAVWSLILGLLSLTLSIQGFYCILFLLTLTGVVLGGIALVKIKTSKGRLRGFCFASIGIITAMVSFVYGARIIPQYLHDVHTQIRCSKNLRELGKAMQIYANDTRKTKYPEANEWCDVLLHLQGPDVQKKTLSVRA